MFFFNSIKGFGLSKISSRPLIPWSECLLRSWRLLCCLVLLSVISVGCMSDKSDEGNGVKDISQDMYLSFLEAGKLKSPYVLIDVRTPEEYAEGHIGGAINIPHDQILNNVTLLDPYQEQSMIFYCHSGGRAGKVTSYLEGLDYENLHHLDGDMKGWRAANHPVEM